MDRIEKVSIRGIEKDDTVGVAGNQSATKVEEGIRFEEMGSIPLKG